MSTIRRSFLFAVAVLFAVPVLHAKGPESAITKQLENYRSIPAAKRPPMFVQLAADIRALPGGPNKVRLADALTHEVTEGENGLQTVQAVADTLAKALAESPVASKGPNPPEAYMDLAKLVRYMHVTETMDDPLYAKSAEILAADDADAEKADFTLKDLHGKKVTLSELRGKIVLVNFWATWCPPCRLEMPDLDALYTHFQSQGLVVLSITSEEAFKVNSVIAPWGYHPPVLLDTDGKVHKLFHITGIPTTFVFDRQGRLVGKGIDQTTLHQFLEMLSKTDLHS
jgi:thiol-disulfide isomerase/thioredoxin